MLSVNWRATLNDRFGSKAATQNGPLDVATLCDFFELHPFTIITLKVEKAILIVNIEPPSVTRALGLKHYRSGEAKGFS